MKIMSEWIFCIARIIFQWLWQFGSGRWHNHCGWVFHETISCNLQWNQHSNWGGRNWCKEKEIHFLEEETKCWAFWSISVKDCKLLSQESVRNVNYALCCAWNYCQHFPCEKTKLLREEFWGLSSEERKTYGMDIPRRLHVRADMKQQKFIMI